VLLNLAADAREQVADFTEEVLHSIIRIYSAENDVNSLIFGILEITMSVHHPKVTMFSHLGLHGTS